jgi:hypothetical protein
MSCTTPQVKAEVLGLPRSIGRRLREPVRRLKSSWRAVHLRVRGILDLAATDVRAIRMVATARELAHDALEVVRTGSERL